MQKICVLLLTRICSLVIIHVCVHELYSPLHTCVFATCRWVFIFVHYTCMCVYVSVFDKLIWRTIGPKCFLFGTAQFSLWASGAVIYDYIVTNSINSLLIGLRCIPNDTHTDHYWANLAHAFKTYPKLWCMYMWPSKRLVVKSNKKFYSSIMQNSQKPNTCTMMISVLLVV